ncbi:hypothetical protein TNCV_1135241 [Trichonephila clavipes]|nr:hypothetical protein TNCV_1135241 [Trichonephila clavipes]
MQLTTELSSSSVMAHQHTTPLATILQKPLILLLQGAGVFPFCRRSVLGNIGSDHLPIKIELKKPRKGILTREMFWNFGKADWPAFAELTEKDFSSLPPSHQLNFKAVVIRNAKETIPRGNFKSFKATYMHNDPCLRALVEIKETDCYKTSNIPPATVSELSLAKLMQNLSVCTQQKSERHGTKSAVKLMLELTTPSYGLLPNLRVETDLKWRSAIQF